ncbi:MAG: GTPase ObgE [Caldisericia bacterium]|nr:GTPase ObgE [Caldisericia bacterium]
MIFLDEITIRVKSGNGGNGCISFRREKYIQKGGPDGGHGGWGGSIIFQADQGISSLSVFQNKRYFAAQNGKPGESNQKNGRKGKHTTILVPPGTLIYEITEPQELVESGAEKTPSIRLLADLCVHGDEVVIAKGGIGGKGNSSFANSIEHVPHIAEHGAVGEEKELYIELKTIADIGFVGFPNAGKSTLLSQITNAKPKIGDYPFTTLVPNVGVCSIAPGKTMTIADIPGIIEGASEGKGLGFQFLRHIERCRILLYIIDLDKESVEECIEEMTALFQEIKDYDEDLFQQSSIVCGNKIDTPRGEKNAILFQEYLETSERPFFFISGKTKQNVDRMILSLYGFLQTIPTKNIPIESHSVHTLGDQEVRVHKEENIYVVQCPRLERIIAGTDLNYPGSLRYVYRMFRKYHIDNILKFHGIQEDDLVELGGKRFRWF